MTIPAGHLDMLADYIANHGQQRYATICGGMRQAYPSVNMRRYLFRKLRNEGRIEKVGYDSYRAATAKAEGGE